MTISAVRQPQGIPAGGQFAPTSHTEPRFTLEPHSTADLAARAAAATPALMRQRAVLEEQLILVGNRQRALSCAAAAHHVLQQHSDAATLVFTVKDDRLTMLASVLDSSGRFLPAHRTGDWADTVMAEVRQERAVDLTGLEGVEAAGAFLRVDVAAVVTAAQPYTTPV
ncbi:hypothetical protein [Arthrobacter methylotrophus]|uniref:DUF222 domain-containing protein n=1 Tax=Arthrobacter methylotrophus TaxID=121291 RepID=A0ABV5UNR7_9MICC